MSIASVSASKAVENVVEREISGGRAGLDSYGNVNFSTCCEVEVSFSDRDVLAATGKSAGHKLPRPFRFMEGYVYGVPMSQAAWDALASDDLRDNACVCSDADYPVGSFVTSFHPTLKLGAQAGGFAGAGAFYGTPAAEYPLGIKLKTGGTTGAPGTATIQCSTDGGTTWCTAYATVASGANTVKDSAGNDTGLRFNLTTTPNFATGDTATLDLDAPGSANAYLKTSPETWTKLN